MLLTFIIPVLLSLQSYFGQQVQHSRVWNHGNHTLSSSEMETIDGVLKKDSSKNNNFIRTKYATDEDDYTSIESIAFSIRTTQQLFHSITILTGLTYENILYVFNIERGRLKFILSQDHRSDLILTTRNNSELINNGQWHRLNIERANQTLRFLLDRIEQSDIELSDEWQAKTNIFIGAELTLVPNGDYNGEIDDILVANAGRSVKLHEDDSSDEDFKVSLLNQTETIVFLPNDNQEIIFPSPIKSILKSLSFSFRAYSNLSTLIQLEAIKLNIDMDGYLTLATRNRQTQRIFANKQQKVVNDGKVYFVQIELNHRTLEVWIDKNQKVSMELFSSFLIIENFIFGLNNQFIGCIENITYNQHLFSFAHLSPNRQQCPIKLTDDLSFNQIISFKESDHPLIIQLNNPEEFDIFSLLFSTQESNCIICSLTDQTYENILLLSIRHEQLFLTYINSEKQQIELSMNYSINDRNEHQIILQKNLLFALDGDMIIKNMTERFSIDRIYIGKLDGVIKEQFPDFNGEDFLGCMKDIMFNHRSVMKFKHIDQSDRLTKTCQLPKRERKLRIRATGLIPRLSFHYLINSLVSLRDKVFMDIFSMLRLIYGRLDIFDILGKNVVSYISSNISFSIRNQSDIIKHQLSFPEEFHHCQFSLKTRSYNGIILSMYSTNDQESLILYLKNGKLQLKHHLSDNTTSHLIFDDHQMINDRQEHHIIISRQISRTISPNKDAIQIFIPLSFNVDVLTLGGSYHVTSNDQLVGCFANVTYNHHPLLPEGRVKSDRYDCFYDQDSICDRQAPCNSIQPLQFCGENDCSLVCVPPIIDIREKSLVEYSSQIKSGEYEHIYLTIFTTAGNSTLFTTKNASSQVSIILQNHYPRLIIQNGGIISTYDFPGRVRGDQWHVLQCQKIANTIDLTFDDESRHYRNLTESFSLFGNQKIHICGKNFIGYVQDIILMADNHHENLIQNSIHNPSLIDYDLSVVWNNRADMPERTPCERIQCLNGGYCIQPTTQTSLAYCNCPSQYTGYRCEQSVTVDPCLNYQCNQGSCQKDRGTQPYCSCYEGYGGSRCETQIDPCARVNCNYGRCEVDRSRPVCRCQQGYAGHECQTVLDACARISCNYGTCINEDTSYRCECHRGYEGVACDRQIDPCSNFVCYHGGLCRIQETNHPVCQCAPGYRGANCYETDVDPCARYDCYGGTCASDRGVARCVCPTGRAGNRCQEDICVLYPCANSGQCVAEGGSRRCVCSTPYYGDDCREVYRPNLCDNIYCGYGQCHEGICECHGGYSGPRCDIAPDLCAGINCHYGTCQEARCICYEGYTGGYCDTQVVVTTPSPAPQVAQTPPRPLLQPQTVGAIGPRTGQLIDYGRLAGARAGPIGWLLAPLAALLLLPLALAFAARQCANGACLPGGTRGYVPVKTGATGATQTDTGAGNRATRDLELIDRRGDALAASSGEFQTERIEQTREVVREYSGMDTAGGVFTTYPTMSSRYGDFARDNQQQQTSSAYSQQHIIETDYHAPPVADFGYGRGGMTEGYRDTVESWETAGGGAYSMNAMFADGGLQTDYELSNINSVSMTPNGKYAIVGQSQGPPQIWDAVNGQLVSSMQGTSSNCSKVALACSGTLLVGLASDGIDAQPSILQIWDVNTGKPVQLTHQIKCATFTLSNNSNNLVMAGNQKYGRGISVGILDLNNSELTKEIKSDTNQSYGGTPSFLTLTPDERYAIVACPSGSTTNYVVFDLTTQQELVQPPTIALDSDPKCSLVLNNEQVLTGTRNGQVILWDIPTCQRIHTLNDNGQSAHRDRVTDIKISPDRSFLVTTSADGTAKVWDTNSKELISKLIGHKREITCVCVSTNQLVATGSKDQNICLWRAHTGQIASTMPVSMTPLDIHMAAHNRTIVAIGDKDGERQLLMLRVVSIQR